MNRPARKDVLAKVRLGQYAQLREGSAWRDLAHLAPAITSGAIDTRYMNLISDDTHPNTLVENGHLDTSCAAPCKRASTPLSPCRW